jgi:D-arabinose 5-phosphate isomerase GutQ
MSGERPWISGDLEITREVMAELEAHALATYPSECCGFVSGPAETPALLDASQREENEADKYHKLDPETFPRTSRTYFKINELRAAKAFDAGDKGGYRHFMLKEIYEQPRAVMNTLEGRLNDAGVLDETFGNGAAELFKKVKHVQIVACGTSYHSAMVARYWLESLAGVSCNVEIASEFRYRRSFVQPDSLIVTISQSGETADTLAALRLAKELGYLGSLTICNVAGSSLVRESDLAFMTRAGAGPWALRTFALPGARSVFPSGAASNAVQVHWGTGYRGQAGRIADLQVGSKRHADCPNRDGLRRGGVPCHADSRLDVTRNPQAKLNSNMHAAEARGSMCQNDTCAARGTA